MTQASYQPLEVPQHELTAVIMACSLQMVSISHAVMKLQRQRFEWFDTSGAAHANVKAASPVDR